MVETARNAFAAGVEQDIVFKQMRVQDLRTDKLNGVIISNPPYGERLLDDKAIATLYKEMGQVFEPLKTWSIFILRVMNSLKFVMVGKQIRNGNYIMVL